MNENIPCEMIEDLLPSYAEGLTNARTNEAVEEHMRTCAACREKLAAMREPEAEKDGADRSEIDFLKKNRRRNRRIAFLSAGAAALIALGVLFVKFFIIGSPSESGGIVARIAVDGAKLTVSGRTRDEGMAVSSVDFREKDGSVFVTTRSVTKSPFASSEFEKEFVSASDIRNVFINGRKVYSMDGKGIALSQEMSDKVKSAYEHFNSLSLEEQMLSSTIPGFCVEWFGTWDGAVELIGFEPTNPLEYDEDFEKKNFGGTDIKDRDGKLMHCEVEWNGTADGEVTWAHATAGYEYEGVRVIYTADLRAMDMVSYEIAQTALSNAEFIVDGVDDGLDAPRLTVDIPNTGVIVKTSDNGRDSANLCFVLSGIPVQVRVINNNGASGAEAYESAIARVIELFDAGEN